MTREEYAEQLNQQVAWASFCEDDPDYDFFGNMLVPVKPDEFREASDDPFDFDDKWRGELIQYRVERNPKWQNIQIAEWYYETGFGFGWQGEYDGPQMDGILVNLTWYELDWATGTVKRFRLLSSPDLTQLTTPPTDEQVEDDENRSTNNSKSQPQISNSKKHRDLHPLLVGEFFDNKLDYEWPQLPKLDVGPPMEEQDLFPTDFFGELYDDSNDQDGFDNG